MAPNVSRIFSRRKPTKAHSTDEAKVDADLIQSPKRSPSQSSASSRSSTHSHLISSLYNEAGKFEKVLLANGCISPRDTPNGTSGFDDLVARDLTNSERAYANHDARILAASDSWISLADLDENLFSDIDTNSEEIASVTTTSTSQSFDSSERPKPTIHRASTIDSQSLESLEPEDIVNILIEEFGTIAAPGEEEKLILETDGALLHDVAIVGVIHLTTHRLTFHASLLATRPDLSSSQEPIKAGPAIMHRKGWRTKRRVWVELTHDMLCAYASSQEDQKARPVCSLLLSFVKDVVPYDKASPRVIRFNVDQHATSINEYAEFDTEESAQEWRREIKGAIFSYRHLRRELYASPTPESSGVRFHCPLTQITSLKWVHESIFSSVVSLTVQLSTSDFQFENEHLPESQVFELGPCETIPTWSRLDEIVAEAKETHREPYSYPPVVVDFGPYNFFETDRNPIKSPGSTKLSARGETAVRIALGFSPESTVWITRARINRSISCTGYFALSDNHLGFWCKNITQADRRYRLPISSIRSIKPFSLSWISVEGLTLSIEGKPDLNFTFKTTLIRDQAIKNIKSAISSHQLAKLDMSSPPASPTSSRSVSLSSISGKLDPVSFFAPLSRSLAAAAAGAASSNIPRMVRLNQVPKVLNFPREVLITEKMLHFVCLTIGSRGDVQPYIALGVRLMKEGHTVTIVTHEEYRDWVVGFGIQHRTAGGDPGALMKLSVENKMFSPEFFKQSLMNFRPWLDQLLIESWAACRDADVLLESPSAMAGVHIAEALNIPYFRTFTMPWTKTSEFPHAFLSPPVDSPTFNAASYVMFSNVMWAATSGQINKWRRNSLGLANTDMGHLAQSKITFIYNFSKAVVPKPLDWPDTTIVSGYWFLDNPDIGWTPPQDLLDWMNKARTDGKPIVYIGFGSITVPRPNKVTATIFKAVLKSGVRAIVSKGWSARMSKPDDKDPPVATPPECFLLDKVPHDWLFPRIDAAVHHGGAGTTGASLRAGIPTIIKPWFGDQFFWASRVQVLGAGIKVSSLHSSALAAAMVKATQDSAMKAKAASVGELIRKEDGVHTAIYTIYTYLHRASQDRKLLV
ncbi:hypothetical protein CVT25_012885 [Psilocybe cyanescens]|uniref:sterol 3beta-glucosyltransferase n=1 Tax=Psilocybe cyanescens TaxID=93625 RepID=A0A409XLN4_PSICY|nr:hypothetical protein CVT25_012885 [Psilocybe cyanescens]